MAEEIMQEKGNETTSNRGRKSAEKQFTRDEVDAIVKAAIEDAMKKVQPQQTIVQVAQEEYVTLVYIGRFANGTSVVMPNWGQITIPGGTIDVPKKDFIRGLGNATNRSLIEKHKLFVVEGLTDAERKRYGLTFEDGKFLTREAFYELLTYPKEKICTLFSNLCEDHKKLVANMFMDAYFDGKDKQIYPDVVKDLNQISKKTNPEGLFTPILKDMGKKFAE